MDANVEVPPRARARWIGTSGTGRFEEMCPRAGVWLHLVGGMEFASHAWGGGPPTRCEIPRPRGGRL
eukprot:7757800-Lingulodinium_polyedra.AAC.1